MNPATEEIVARANAEEIAVGRVGRPVIILASAAVKMLLQR
jgi:hypothetical protein